MSPQEARALAMAYSLYQCLAELYEHGAGSHIERSWDLVDEAIAELEGEQTMPRLIISRQEVRQL